MLVIRRGAGTLLFLCLFPGALLASPGDDLEAAIKAGDVEVVERLASSAVNVNAVDGNGGHLLDVAFGRERPEVFEILYLAGARWPSDIASEPHHSRLERLRKAVAWAEDSKPKPEVWRGDRGGERAHSIYPLQSLLEAGVAPNQFPEPDRLLSMLQAGDLLLLKNLAVRNPRTDQKADPLCLAIERGDDELVDLLLTHDWTLGRCTFSAEGFNRTPLYYAIRRRDVALVQTLVKAGADPGKRRGVLVTAAQAGVPEIVEILLAAGAKPNFGAPYETLQTPLVAAVEAGDVGIVRLLLVAGADPNHRSRDKKVPLMSALSQRRMDIVRELIAYGARGAIASEVLLEVAGTQHRYELLEVLAGATDQSITRSFLKTCRPDLFLAYLTRVQSLSTHDLFPENIVPSSEWWQCPKDVRFKMLDLLLKFGAKIDGRRDKDGETLLLQWVARGFRSEWISQLLKRGADPSIVNSSGQNAILLAVDPKRLRHSLRESGPVLRLLIEHGVDPNFVSLSGETALKNSLASDGEKLLLDCSRYGEDRGNCVNRNRQVTEAQGLQLIDRLRTLLAAPRVRIDVQDSQGMTALMWAAQLSLWPAFEVLLESGASVEIVDMSGRTVSDHYWLAVTKEDKRRSVQNRLAQLSVEVADTHTPATDRQLSYRLSDLIEATGVEQTILVAEVDTRERFIFLALSAVSERDSLSSEISKRLRESNMWEEVLAVRLNDGLRAWRRVIWVEGSDLELVQATRIVAVIPWSPHPLYAMVEGDSSDEQFLIWLLEGFIGSLKQEAPLTPHEELGVELQESGDLGFYLQRKRLLLSMVAASLASLVIVFYAYRSRRGRMPS